MDISKKSVIFTLHNISFYDKAPEKHSDRAVHPCSSPGFLTCSCPGILFNLVAGLGCVSLWRESGLTQRPSAEALCEWSQLGLLRDHGAT